MVSRRNYFSITVIMCIIFFLFQFTNAAKEHWNEYGVNDYAKEEERPSLTQILAGRGQEEETWEGGAGRGYLSEQDGDKAGTGQMTKTEGNEAGGKQAVSEEKASAKLLSGTLLVIGEQEGSLVQMGESWAFGARKEFARVSLLSEFSEEKIVAGTILLVDNACVDWGKESEILQGYVDKGAILIVSGMPDTAILEKNKQAAKLLGVERIREKETTVDGLHLYSGFLLGGEVIYQAETQKEEKKQDLSLTFPWYQLSSGTKVYMRGRIEDTELENSECPPVIWRKSFPSGGYVFVVNGDYLEESTGIGLLSAMEYETRDWILYPVVNAQNLVFANFPGTANENEETMMAYYSQSMKGFERDVCWPTLASVLERGKLGLTCMVAPQFDYEDEALPSDSDLVYYMKLVKEAQGEAGLSGFQVSDTGIEEKLTQDEALWSRATEGYTISSFYTGELSKEEVDSALSTPLLSKVRTVLTKEDEEGGVLGFWSNGITRQMAVADGFIHTFSDDLRLRSVETALGYSSVLVDLSRAMYPQGKEDAWEVLGDDLASNLSTYWKPFSGFDKATLTQSDARIRGFLAVEYQVLKEGESMKLLLSKKEGETLGSKSTESPSFLLRLHTGEVERVEGGSFVKLEKNAYLIRADKVEVTIHLKNKDQRYYHE